MKTLKAIGAAGRKGSHAVSDRMFPSISYTVFIQP